MDDLISRTKVIEAIRKEREWLDENITDAEHHYHMMNENARLTTAIWRLPSEQSEIIHCKDCEWWEKQKDSIQGRCELMQMYPTGEWLCGNAKRRTDE